MRMRKSAVLSFSVTVEPASSLSLSRPETFSDSRHSRSSSGRNSAMSLVEGGFGRNALGFAVRRDAPVVAPAREPRQSRALGAVAAHQLGLAGPLQVADGTKPILGEPRRAPCRRQRSATPARRRGTRPPRRRRARRSRAACRDRRRSWPGTCCSDKPDRHGDADLASRLGAAKPASDLAGDMPCRRAVPDKSMNASSIDTGSTSGVEVEHQRAHLRGRRAAYFAMSGRTTLACGQSRRASNIGMAERTPKVRAT